MEKFLVESETEYKKELGVDGEERCESQPSPVVACLMVKNSSEQKHGKKDLLVILRREMLAGRSKVRTDEERVLV